MQSTVKTGLALAAAAAALFATALPTAAVADEVQRSATAGAGTPWRDIVVVAGKEIDLGTITVRPGRKVAGKVVDGK